MAVLITLAYCSPAHYRQGRLAVPVKIIGQCAAAECLITAARRVCPQRAWRQRRYCRVVLALKGGIADAYGAPGCVCVSAQKCRRGVCSGCVALRARKPTAVFSTAYVGLKSEEAEGDVISPGCCFGGPGAQSLLAYAGCIVLYALINRWRVVWGGLSLRCCWLLDNRIAMLP